MAAARTTVMILDDHPLFRQGIRRIIEDSGRYTVVAEAAAGYEAIRLADIHEPRLILSDIQLPGITGLKIARILRKQHPRTRIVFCTMHDDDEKLIDALRVGAAAFLAKDVEAETLIDTLDRVVDGEQVISGTLLSRPHLAWRVLSEFRSMTEPRAGTLADTARGAFPLSVREAEVLDCVAQGFSNREVADALFITEQTVKNHMTSVLRKLEVEDRVQALLYAVRQGWIQIGPETGAGVFAV